MSRTTKILVAITVLIASFSTKGLTQDLCSEPVQTVCSYKNSIFVPKGSDLHQIRRAFFSLGSDPRWNQEAKKIGSGFKEKDAQLLNSFTKIKGILPKVTGYQVVDQQAVDGIDVFLYGEYLSNFSVADHRSGLVRQILEFCGSGNIPNAVAAEKVFLCPIYYGLIAQDEDTLWVSAVLAHELGHILDGVSVSFLVGYYAQEIHRSPPLVPEPLDYMNSIENAKLGYKASYKEEVIAHYWMARILLELIEEKTEDVSRKREMFSKALQPFCEMDKLNKGSETHPDVSTMFKSIMEIPEIKTSLQCGSHL